MMSSRRKQTALYLFYSDPANYPPLEHSSKILAEGGWAVHFVGVRSDAGNEWPPHPRITLDRMRRCPPGWLQKIHYAVFCLKAMGAVIAKRPDFVYASDALVAPAALLVKFFFRTSVYYHEHDIFTVNGRWSRQIDNTRKCMASEASVCIFPSQKRLGQFIQAAGPPLKAYCVRNMPSFNEVAASRKPKSPSSLRLLYCGSIVPDRLPLSILEAMVDFKEVSLSVVGYETAGSRGYVAAIRTAAEKRGMADRVHFLHARDRREAFAEFDRCDAGLALLPLGSTDENHVSMLGASNKPYEYAARGLAVIVPRLPDWEKDFVETGYGFSCDPADPKSLAEIIQRMVDNPDLARTMGEKARRRILDEWNYEKEFEPVYRRMNSERDELS